MNVEITRLSNGLTVITDPMPQLETAALGVWVDTGARNEAEQVSGISHMLEHMAFKGTASRSARAIAEEIEAVGGYLNAYTSREQTAFHARILKADTALALDLLSDILLAPSFEQSELERERQVVLQEIGQARDTPDDIIFDHLQGVLYPDQPLGRAILGEENTVSQFTQTHLREYMSANYRAGGMTLVASGAVNHDDILRLANEKFGRLQTGVPAAPAAARYVGGDMREIGDLEQAHLTFAVPGVANDDPDYYAAQVYITALGGGMSSRLFQEAREKRGLCYSIYAFAQSYQDGGVLGVYAGTGEKEASEIAAVIAGEMEAMAHDTSEGEVKRAKAQLKSSMLMGLERPSSRAEQIASNIFAYGRFVEPEEIVSKLDAVDATVIRKFAERIMSCTRPAIAALGPVGKLESYESFARRFGGAGARRAAE